MKRILFVDDEEYRHKIIAAKLVVDHAYTYDEAIHKLTANEYSVVFLDHDMELRHYQLLGSSDYTKEVLERTGYNIACWMVENKRIPTNAVVIHTMNSVGGNRMYQALLDTDCATIRCTFGTDKFDRLLVNIRTWQEDE